MKITDKQAACKHTYIDKHGYCEKCKLQTNKSISDIEQELNKLKVSKADPKRLNELQKLMDFFNFGIR